MKKKEKRKDIYIYHIYTYISVKKTRDNRQRKDRGNCDYDDFFVVVFVKRNEFITVSKTNKNNLNVYI